MNNLGADDLSLFAQLDQRCMPFPWELHQWRELAGDSKYFLGSVYSEEILVGFCLYYIPVDQEAELLKIAILPESRGRKLGPQLLANSLKSLKDLGVREIFLEVQELNLAAIKLYQKLGFQQIRTVHSFYSNGDTALIFSRALDT